MFFKVFFFESKYKDCNYTFNIKWEILKDLFAFILELIFIKQMYFIHENRKICDAYLFSTSEERKIRFSIWKITRCWDI